MSTPGVYLPKSNRDLSRSVVWRIACPISRPGSAWPCILGSRSNRRGSKARWYLRARRDNGRGPVLPPCDMAARPASPRRQPVTGMPLRRGLRLRGPHASPFGLAALALGAIPPTPPLSLGAAQIVGEGVPLAAARSRRPASLGQLDPRDTGSLEQTGPSALQGHREGLLVPEEHGLGPEGPPGPGAAPGRAGCAGTRLPFVQWPPAECHHDRASDVSQQACRRSRPREASAGAHPPPER